MGGGWNSLTTEVELVEAAVVVTEVEAAIAVAAVVAVVVLI